MTATVVVLDYGSGNLRSAERALERVRAGALTVTADPDARLDWRRPRRCPASARCRRLHGEHGSAGGGELGVGPPTDELGRPSWAGA